MKTRYRQVAPVFAVSSVKEAVDWYKNAFGLEVKYINGEDDDPEGDAWNYALLHKEALEIHLAIKQDNDITLQSPSNCYLFLCEIDDLHNHLKNLNVEVGDIIEMPWGHRECFVDDPFGNRLVLSEIPE